MDPDGIKCWRWGPDASHRRSWNQQIRRSHRVTADHESRSIPDLLSRFVLRADERYAEGGLRPNNEPVVRSWRRGKRFSVPLPKHHLGLARSCELHCGESVEPIQNEGRRFFNRQEIATLSHSGAGYRGEESMDPQVIRYRPTESLEMNRRTASALSEWRKLGRAVYARPCVSGDGSRLR